MNSCNGEADVQKERKKGQRTKTNRGKQLQGVLMSTGSDCKEGRVYCQSQPFFSMKGKGREVNICPSCNWKAVVGKNKGSF